MEISYCFRCRCYRKLVVLNRYCNYAMQSSVIVGGTAYRPGYKSDELRESRKNKEEITPQVREKNPMAAFPPLIS